MQHPNKAENSQDCFLDRLIFNLLYLFWSSFPVHGCNHMIWVCEVKIEKIQKGHPLYITNLGIRMTMMIQPATAALRFQPDLTPAAAGSP